jgi:hypothetical protein
MGFFHSLKTFGYGIPYVLFLTFLIGIPVLFLLNFCAAVDYTDGSAYYCGTSITAIFGSFLHPYVERDDYWLLYHPLWTFVYLFAIIGAIWFGSRSFSRINRQPIHHA